MNTNIGKNIRDLREAKGITQLNLANMIGVTKGTVSAYEVGSRLPSYDVLIKLAYIFHVSTDNLLGFSSKYVIDVTDLNAHQRNMIQEIVDAFAEKNTKSAGK